MVSNGKILKNFDESTYKTPHRPFLGNLGNFEKFEKFTPPPPPPKKNQFLLNF